MENFLVISRLIKQTNFTTKILSKTGQLNLTNSMTGDSMFLPKDEKKNFIPKRIMVKHNKPWNKLLY